MIHTFQQRSIERQQKCYLYTINYNIYISSKNKQKPKHNFPFKKEMKYLFHMHTHCIPIHIHVVPTEHINTRNFQTHLTVFVKLSFRKAKQKPKKKVIEKFVLINYIDDLYCGLCIIQQ